MDGGELLINLVWVGAAIGVYFVWESLKSNPAKRWPKMAKTLGLAFEDSPPRLSGAWGARTVRVQAHGNRAVASFSVRPGALTRLEIGPREKVEKAAGMVVPDRVAFDGTADRAFSERFVVRAQPQSAGVKALDNTVRQRLTEAGDIHILAQGPSLQILLPAACEARELRAALEIGGALLDALEG